MPTHDNPYSPPADPDLLTANPGFSLTQFCWLNVTIAAALGNLILAFYLSTEFEGGQADQQLPGRYASYDHEFSISGVFLLAVVFVIPNVVLLVAQFWRHKRAPRELEK